MLDEFECAYWLFYKFVGIFFCEFREVFFYFIYYILFEHLAY